MKIYPVQIENEELWKEVKKRCLDVGMTPRDVIMELLRAWVEGAVNIDRGTESVIKKIIPEKPVRTPGRDFRKYPRKSLRREEGSKE
jgi:hypothetical protein